MEIRPLTKADTEDFMYIFKEAYDYQYLNIIEDYPGFDDYYDYLINKGYSFILLNDEGKKCGFITAYTLPEMEYGKTMFIEDIAVLPEEQGKGYGKALINTIENTAKEHHIGELSLRTNCYRDAYLIYRHLGFKDQRSDARYMTRRIKDVPIKKEN